MTNQTSLSMALRGRYKKVIRFRPPEQVRPDESEGPQFGASDDWLKPFDPSAESGAGKDDEPTSSDAQTKMSAYVDKLGRVYPVDVFGNIIRKTGRPFGVTTKQWTSASRKQKINTSKRSKGSPQMLTWQTRG